MCYWGFAYMHVIPKQYIIRFCGFKSTQMMSYFMQDSVLFILNVHCVFKNSPCWCMYISFFSFSCYIEFCHIIIHHILFIYLLIDGHLCRFPFSTLINNAAKHILVQVLYMTNYCQISLQTSAPFHTLMTHWRALSGVYQ